MPKLADWVKETVSGTPGTGTITLGGAVTGFCRFQDQFTTGDKVKYVVQDGNNKEEGIGTLTTGTPWTLARTTVQQTIDAGTFNKSSPSAISLTSAAIVGISASADVTGIIVGSAFSSISTVISCTTRVFFDNTIPQITEGNEVLTLAYTPKFADSKLQITAVLEGSMKNTAADQALMALFKDTTADAIKAQTWYTGAISSHISGCIIHEENANDTSSRTYKLRAGGVTYDFYVNGNAAGVQLLGGTASTCLKIIEIRQ